MSKRKSVRFAEDAKEDPEEESAKKRAKLAEEGDGKDFQFKNEIDVGEDFKDQHTLESDEEEEEKYSRLDINTVEGQEEKSTGVGDDDDDFDGNTKITPFNMKDEMDDGHFDSTGNFIFNKKSDDIKDEWLDNVDWSRVKKDAGDLWKKQVGGGGDGDDDDKEEGDADSPPPHTAASKLNRYSVYSSMLESMQPKETVTKCLKRLGGNESAADARKRRWKAKKEASSKAAVGGDATPSSESLSVVDRFTGLVDSLVSDGVMEVYGFTYEKVKHEVDQLDAVRVAKFGGGSSNNKKDGGDGNDDDGDDELDMFGKEVDASVAEEMNAPGGSSSSQQKAENVAGNEAETTTSKASNSGEKDKDTNDDAVKWEFKWSEDGEIQGPCSSEQMMNWKDEGYFKDGVVVRKIGSSTDENTPFYSCKRIDFDLYCD